MMKGASPLLYRTPDTDYFRWKYWIIPFNRNHHWLLGIVEFSEHQIVNINAPCKATIRMFDSKLGLNANKYCQDLCFQFLLREFHRKFNISKVDIVVDESFKCLEVDQGVDNSWDCGPFTIYHFHRFFTEGLKVKSDILFPKDLKLIGPKVRDLINYYSNESFKATTDDTNQSKAIKEVLKPPADNSKKDLLIESGESDEVIKQPKQRKEFKYDKYSKLHFEDHEPIQIYEEPLKKVEELARLYFGSYYEKFISIICKLPTEFTKGITWNKIKQKIRSKYRFPEEMDKFKNKLEELHVISTEYRSKSGLMVKRNF